MSISLIFGLIWGKICSKTFSLSCTAWRIASISSSSLTRRIFSTIPVSGTTSIFFLASPFFISCAALYRV